MTNPLSLDFTGLEGIFCLFFLQKSGYTQFASICLHKFFIGSTLVFYSVRKAATGSFLAAFFDGIKPPISVRNTLNTIKIIALETGSCALTLVVPAIA